MSRVRGPSVRWEAENLKWVNQHPRGFYVCEWAESDGILHRETFAREWQAKTRARQVRDDRRSARKINPGVRT